MTNATALAFTVYMADATLARDLDILYRCGRVQQHCADAGDDSPAAWFAQAARSYPPCDDLNRLARRACELVAAELQSGVQQ